ncbi:uncharacterized protein LOC128290549 [Gossypium arboreum]|uniref:uncharacterized protein LOC128290549 n=1 Tax=Gossypium arboreum TaxID=29729 RepID=UPI0022F1CDD4|nr:uncharacterized protein LOC128290549 [Gossypium arboreum]
MQHRPNQSQGFNQKAPKPPQVKASNSLDNLLKVYMKKNDDLVQSQAATLKNLENQMGQLATELRKRPQRTLSSDTENPKNLSKEHIKKVALRSGKILEPRLIDAEDEPVEKEESQPAVEIPTPKESETAKTDMVNPNLVNSYTLTSYLDADLPTQKSCPAQLKVPSPPYPQRLQQHKLKQEDVLSKKKRLSGYETVALKKECSAFLQNKLPPKLKDPKSFTIPYNIGESYYDFEADKEVPIILVRPFLATGRTLIDVQKEECSVMEELETLISMESNFEEDPLEKTFEFDPLEDEESEENMVLVEANLRNFIQPTRDHVKTQANLKGQYVQGCITSHDLEKLVEKVHELNQGEQKEATEPDTEESTNETETESITATEVKESDKESKNPKPVEGSKNLESRVELKEEPVKLSVEPEYTTPMLTFASTSRKSELSILMDMCKCHLLDMDRRY